MLALLIYINKSLSVCQQKRLPSAKFGTSHVKKQRFHHREAVEVCARIITS